MTDVPSRRRSLEFGWLGLGVVLVVLMVIGVQRDAGPATPQERVEAIARRLACPTCEGESVAESRGAASQAIRKEVTRLVSEGRMSDDEIVSAIDDAYAESLKLTPGSSGIDILVWVLPGIVAVAAIGGTVVAFRRWRTANPASAGGESDSGERNSTRSTVMRTAIGLAVVLTVILIVGLTVARNSGDRRPGQGMTGGGQEQSVSNLLVQARSMGMGDVQTALTLYAQVLEKEPDNLEALTYFGWLTVLSASQIEDQDLAVGRLQSGLVLLRQATVVDPTYPDAHCFLGISFFRFLGDAEAAAPEIKTCLASNPPSEVAVLVEGLARQIEDALKNPTSSQDPSTEK